MFANLNIKLLIRIIFMNLFRNNDVVSLYYTYIYPTAISDNSADILI